MTQLDTRNPLALRVDIHPRAQRFLMFVLDEMANEYERSHDDVIRLTLGKSELPPATAVTDAMVEALRSPERYSLVFPAGLPQLRERIAAEYDRRFGVAVRPDNVIVNNGTSGLFRNLFHLLVGPGDEVLLPLPYYPLYAFCARLAGATVRHYRIDPASLRVDHESLARNLGDSTRIVVLNSPGNPLGNIVTNDDIQRIDEAVDGRSLIICDEIYGNCCFDSEEESALQLEQLRSPLVVTNGFSKAHRMYARRVGYAVVPDELTGPLTVVQHHTLLTTDPVPQFGALVALDRPQDVPQLLERYRERRDFTMARLSHLQDVLPICSRGGFYFSIECSQFMGRWNIESSLEVAQMIMRSVHVATVPGSDFGLPTILRLSYTAARYEEAIDRLAHFFSRPWAR